MSEEITSLTAFYSSPTIGEIAKALAAAQGEVEGAKKTAENPGFKRDGKNLKYADLASVWDACREALSKNGLAVVQLPVPGDDQHLHLLTRLIHTSGEWIASHIAIPLAANSAHGYGSALTYARRYGLSAMVGIAQEDDDGNGAVAAPQQTPAQQTPQQATNLGANPQVVALKKTWWTALCAADGLTELDPKPDKPNNVKPSREWWKLAKQHSLPSAWSTWTAAQAQKAIEIVAAYRPVSPAVAFTEEGVYDGADPFADQ